MAEAENLNLMAARSELSLLAQGPSLGAPLASLQLQSLKDISRLSFLFRIFDSRGGYLGSTGVDIAASMASQQVLLCRFTEAPSLPSDIPIRGPGGRYILMTISWQSPSAEESRRERHLFIDEEELIAGAAPLDLTWSMSTLLEAESFMPNHLHEALNDGAVSVPVAYLETEMRSDDLVGDSGLSEANRRLDSGYIRFIEVGGYRSFLTTQRLKLAIPDGQTEGSGLTLVVGANSSGKSALWEGFDALARTIAGHNLIFAATRINSATSDGVYFGVQNESDVLVTLSSDAPNSAFSTRRVVDGQGSDFNSAVDPLKIWALPARRQFEPYFGPTMGDPLNWAVRSGQYSRTALRNEFVELLVDISRSDEKKRGFDALLKEVIGRELVWGIGAQDAQHGVTFFLKVTSESGASHTSEGLGEGITSLFFILAVVQMAESGRAIVIDEPELSLHPQLIRRLRTVLARISMHRQIVILTHSPLLVSWQHLIDGAEIARVYRDEAGHSMIAQLDRATVQKIPGVLGDRNNLHTLGLDATESLFLEDGVLLLEGQEDVYFFPRILQQLEKSANLFNFWGWGIGGETRLELMMQILRDLGFSKVAAILDEPREHKRSDFEAQLLNLKTMFPSYHVSVWPAKDIRTKEEKKNTCPENGKAEENLVTVEGVLDKKYEIRSELLDGVREIVESVATYFDT